MKKMNTNEMRKVNGGFFWEAVIGWMIGRTIVCGTKGFGKC
jgi:bacteriocin-like protein